MKPLLVMLALLHLNSQINAQTAYQTVDSIARITPKNPYPTPEALAKALCKDLKSDHEKARALFSWLADNIRYDRAALEGASPEPTLKDYEDKLIKQAYRNKKGVCMHYSLLYKRMADAVGLECQYIGGYSKGSVRGDWGSHAWNAVKIDGEWKLLDATWGAGYFDDNNKFRKSFQAGYFFTPPRIFALDHLPDDEKWQLLEIPLSKSSFKKQCTFSYGDPQRDISDVMPFNTPLTEGPDGKLELKLKIIQPPAVILLTVGKKEIPFERSEQEGWVTLRFQTPPGRDVQVWGGKKTGKSISTSLMGIFHTK